MSSWHLPVVILSEAKNLAPSRPPSVLSLVANTSVQPEHWLRYKIMSMLGEARLAQKQYAEAETLLLAGYEGMRQHEEGLTKKQRLILQIEALKKIVNLYETWHKADPDGGFDAKAAEWKRKLTDREAPQ